VITFKVRQCVDWWMFFFLFSPWSCWLSTSSKWIRSNYISQSIPCPDAPCMEYLPTTFTTFGWFLGQMVVHIPYMEHLGCVGCMLICVWFGRLPARIFWVFFIGTSCGRRRGRSMVGHGTLPRDVGASENGCYDLQLTILFILDPLQDEWWSPLNPIKAP